MKIKASGGVKTREFAEELILAGASIVGCSSSVSFMENAKV
jgi:deoxyribose-phosphate aldolase